MPYNILPRQVVFSDKAVVAPGASVPIVTDSASGGQFLELRSIQCTPVADVKMIIEVDKDTLLTIVTSCLGESPEKAFGVFIVADERKSLKITLQNSGAAEATMNYLINGLVKKKAKEQEA
jgi:hypothetical protein